MKGIAEFEIDIFFEIHQKLENVFKWWFWRVPSKKNLTTKFDSRVEKCVEKNPREGKYWKERVCGESNIFQELKPFVSVCIWSLVFLIKANENPIRYHFQVHGILSATNRLSFFFFFFFSAFNIF